MAFLRCTAKLGKFLAHGHSPNFPLPFVSNVVYYAERRWAFARNEFIDLAVHQSFCTSAPLRDRKPLTSVLKRLFTLFSFTSPVNSSANIVSSRYPDLELVEDKSLPDFLFEKFDTFGNKRAIIDGVSGQEYSYSQVRELSLKFGSALTKLGFKKGDVFATYCPNIVEFPIIYLGVLSLGGILTTVSSMATVHEICLQMKDSKAKYIITVPPFALNAKQAAKQCGLNEVFVVGEAEGCRPVSSLFQDDGKSFPTNVRINPKEDVAVIPYSSGTTGLPKGIMLTHFNLTCNIQQSIDGDNSHYQSTPDDNLLAVVPFFHIFGFSVIQGFAFYCGASIISLPKFEEEMFLQTVEKYKVSKIFAVPPLVLFLAKHAMVEKYDLSSVCDVFCGAAPLSEDLELQAAGRLKGVDHIRQGYGMTETSPVVLSIPSNRKKGGAVGLNIRNTEVKVVDLDTGAALGANEKGEIHVRGPQVMKGYLNKPQMTNEVISSNGWLSTGDIGYYDSDNFFYIVDRCKELIKYKAYQVAPAEIEALLISHPKIQDAAVIGVPDDSAGELPKAYVVSTSGISKEEINTYVEKSLAPYKKLRGGIEFIGEIPKSNTGKILRRVLKER